MFENNIATSDCLSIRKRYRHALVSSLGEQMRGREREMGKAHQQRLNTIMHDDSLLPSCDILARVSKEMTGKVTFWHGCLGFGTMPQDEHLKRCLATFVPGYFGKGRKVESLQGCGDVLGSYEGGLRTADPDKKLPAGYSRPECTVAADYLASLKPKPVAAASGDQARPKWEPCMEYDPADVPAHLRRCLGLADRIRRAHG